VQTREIYPTSQMLTFLTGEGVQANKAIVGRNAFAHEAGIHQDGMLKDRRTYEIIRPEEVGVPQATLVLGKHSGRHAVQRRCELVGITLERRELDEVYRAVIAHAEREKIVTDADLLSIVSQVRSAGARRPSMSPAVSDSLSTPVESGYGHGV
jgi:2-isopropylmalate synthase